MRNVVLIGMPGSGKTEVGRLVAERLGWTFLDTDALVQQRTGRAIPAIFEQDGEAAFRDVERAVVREVARARRAVIATGGGAVLDPGNMAALRRSGVLVALTAPPEVLLARLGPAGSGRPLLAGDVPERLRALLAARRDLYARAEVQLDASRPSEALADEVLGALRDRVAETVTVDLGAAAYPVRVGAGVLDLLGWELRSRTPPGRAVLLTHRRLWRRFGGRLERTLRAAGFDPLSLAVPEGEGSKGLRRASAVIDRMAAAGVDRGDVLIGVGGGVVGDLAGFVAGVYMRGLALAHVPTTLLAQVDSAIGGKAAVNHPRAKNLIGVFHQPVLVVADVETLRRLPDREMRAGLAEVVKYGMIADAGLLAFVDAHLDALLARDPEALRQCVRRCAAIKAAVVAADEREERGPRRLLNYGHTIGHALERLTPGLAHGEAVAVGMSLEARVAQRLGLIPEDVVRRQHALLVRAGLPTRVPQAAPDSAALFEAMRLDKKTRRGELRFTLLKSAGDGVIDQVVPDALVREVLDGARGG